MHLLTRMAPCALLLSVFACDGTSPAPASTSSALEPECVGSRTSIILPGPSFFPEGINVGPDGTIYVSSNGDGSIVRAPLGVSVAEPLIPASAPPLTTFGAYGIAVDTLRQTIWACTANDNLLPAQEMYLRSYDLHTGTETAAYVLPSIVSSFCNGLVLDDRGNVYATDSLANTIVELPSGGHEMRTWAKDAKFQGAPNVFTLNGIVFDPIRRQLLVVRSDTGDLLAVPIRADDSPGAVVNIPVDPPLVNPDDISFVNPWTLAVAENSAGQVSLVHFTPDGRGRKRVIASGFHEPTAVATLGDSVWVTISQDRAFSGKEKPSLPFIVQRVRLPFDAW